ncbi:hypothetical protein EBZ35_04430 [bacterium]|nr:hypothetical protein [bacterium]
MNRGTPLPVHQHAKMGVFAGLAMPMWYEGVRQEHTAVRQSVGVFDVSHMAIMWLTGPNKQVLHAIETIGCAAVSVRAKKGRMTYSMILNEQGGIVDDVMVGPVGDRWLLVANAVNATAVLGRFQSVPGVTIERDHRLAMLAVQGPRAMALGAQLLGQGMPLPFGVARMSWQGEEVVVSRTGYTGEDGFEIIGSPAVMTHYWQACLAEGAVPCGLAARDSLRIESGLPLYGQELGPDRSPLETRYPWVLSSSLPYVGHEAVAAKRLALTDTTVGLRLSTRAIARLGTLIQEGGVVTSGTLTPQSDTSIAMAVVPMPLSTVGTVLHVLLRGVPTRAVVVPVPFDKKEV